MSPRASRTDANQTEIVEALRGIGCTVEVASSLRRGFPDLIVGYRGQTYLIEVKAPAGPKGGTSGRDLTPGQQEWHVWWRGHVAIARTADEAIAIVQEAAV